MPGRAYRVVHLCIDVYGIMCECVLGCAEAWFERVSVVNGLNLFVCARVRVPLCVWGSYVYVCVCVKGLL